MQAELQGVKIAVLGGDARELILVQRLLQLGAELKLVGYPKLPELTAATHVTSIEEALKGAQAIIAPMSNTDHEGVIKATLEPGVRLALGPGVFQEVAPNTPFCIGNAKPCVRQWVEAAGLQLIELAEVEEIAIANSIPTAEGAIQIAMEELPITLHGCNAVTLGFGRCGITLARMLAALGARTTVVARSPAQRARAREMGLASADFSELGAVIANADVIFNTIPALVLTKELLAETKRQPLIIDLASAPGGTDFEAAAALGLKAKLALGLPGKVAPKSAGEILAQTVPRLLCSALARVNA